MFKGTIKGIRRCLTGTAKGVGKVVNSRVRRFLSRRNEKKKQKSEQKARAGTAQEQKPVITHDYSNDTSKSEERIPVKKLNATVETDQGEDDIQIEDDESTASNREL